MLVLFFIMFLLLHVALYFIHNSCAFASQMGKMGGQSGKKICSVSQSGTGLCRSRKEGKEKTTSVEVRVWECVWCTYYVRVFLKDTLWTDTMLTRHILLAILVTAVGNSANPKNKINLFIFCPINLHRRSCFYRGFVGRPTAVDTIYCDENKI